MREIEFRGKRVEDYEWVYGDFSRIVTPSRIIYAISISACLYEIDPDTVGQYTGLKDSKGNKIYEGDIVRYSTSEHLFDDRIYSGVIKWLAYGRETGFYVWKNKEVEYNQENKFFELGTACYLYDDIEVIGNIYDNPELLNENYEETEDEVNND